MSNRTNLKILFVINPKSGNALTDDYHSVISASAEKYGFQWKVFETTGEDDSIKIRAQIKNFEPQKVIAAGGDGTVNLVAAELLETNIELGIIPSGSANGLAFNFGVPENFKRALSFNLENPAIPMDAIKINDRHFCLHLSDVGINARIVKRFEKEGSKGLIGYGKQLIKELMAGKTYFSFYIEIPGQRRKKMKTEMLVIANAKSFGTGAIINPTGKIDDGKFEIVIIRPYPWWSVFTFIFAAFTGSLHRMKYVKIFSVEKAKISLAEPHVFQIDGEIIPQASSLEIEIMPQAIKFCRRKD